MSQVIIGAGMAGLLAARMLRHLNPVIYEARSELPHNHHAVLRFSSSIVGDVLGIPFKRVNLVKTVVPWRNPVADAMAYSSKVLGVYRSDRSVLLPERWTSSERYIAPPDLVERMAEGTDVKYSKPYDFPPGAPKVISTIPMPTLARLMGYPHDLNWEWLGGQNIEARLVKCDAYVTVYVPNPDVAFYRASITGDQLVIELTQRADPFADPDRLIGQALDMLGVRKTDVYRNTERIHEQEYAKIAPINDADRKRFIFWASTVTGRTYQLGRFATWRPGLLMDDLVKDVRIIENWIRSPSRDYDMEEHERRGSSFAEPAHHGPAGDSGTSPGRARGPDQRPGSTQVGRAPTPQS